MRTALHNNPLPAWTSAWRLGIKCSPLPRASRSGLSDHRTAPFWTYGMVSTPPRNPYTGSGGLHPGWCPASPAGQPNLRTEGTTGANTIVHIRIGAEVTARRSEPITPKYGGNCPTWRASMGHPQVPNLGWLVLWWFFWSVNQARNLYQLWWSQLPCTLP